jgi:hypothetical protein
MERKLLNIMRRDLMKNEDIGRTTNIKDVAAAATDAT